MGLFDKLKKKEKTNDENKIPVVSIACDKEKMDHRNGIVTITVDSGTYRYRQLEEIDGLQGYSFAVSLEINDVAYFLYFSNILDRSGVVGWNVMSIEKSVYEQIKDKTITERFKVVHFLGETPFSSPIKSMPYVVAQLMSK